jgi:aryl-alcohol dehydrogenase-like predicted oxidoreductase
MRSVSQLVALGKVKYVGLSEVSPRLLRAAHQISPVSCIQQEWSVVTRGAVEEELVPVCRELSIGIVCYSPLGRGLLTESTIRKEDQKDDWRQKLPRFNGANFVLNEIVIREIGDLGQKLHATTSQLSLAWLYHHAEKLGVTICAIPGSSKLEHALSNLKSVHLRLALCDFAIVAELGSRVAGARHTQEYTKMALEGLLNLPT